jgi:hypothetical protein
MGINRWSDIEERKRNETYAKADDEVPKGNKEERQVVEKLEKRKRES